MWYVIPMPQLDELPLKYHTPAAWGRQVLRDPLALLNDHAHLEKKAAANAFELLNRWPEPSPPENWVAAMCAVARDEAEHLGVVTRLLARRGGKLTHSHRNPYAAELRSLVRMGRGDDELVDRLMISALIEARSCERFALLADVCDDDRELKKLYRGLWASEHGHYRMFIQLAEAVQSKSKVERRWLQMLNAEAKIIQAQTPGPRMHSGLEN
ncbi:tRNA-(ms[2]io[6]A)-hydroxylase [Planctomycetales bacterium ZRK34]|nr:tRNA-(ms[2]io[6]A)-hydroxylase [Planctomycetales bacterium ZRK34]